MNLNYRDKMDIIYYVLQKILPLQLRRFNFSPVQYGADRINYVISIMELKYLYMCHIIERLGINTTLELGFLLDCRQVKLMGHSYDTYIVHRKTNNYFLRKHIELVKFYRMTYII